MITLKFGGTSMGSAKRILNSSKIVIDRDKEKGRVSVIVSAVAGISNKLQEAIDYCISSDSEREGLLKECIKVNERKNYACEADGYLQRFYEELTQVHYNIIEELQKSLPLYDTSKVKSKIDAVIGEIKRALDGSLSLRECPINAYCKIMGAGEMLSTPIMEETLNAQGIKVRSFDSRAYIYTTGRQDEGDVDYTRTEAAFIPLRDGGKYQEVSVLLFPGFISSWYGNTIAEEGKSVSTAPGLLGRNGSDFSASIVGYCLNASKVEIWTDVDGIYTADPKVVKDAIVIKNMSYEEAMELSFFGSKVLHPKTIYPLEQKGIEIYSLNSYNTSSSGTRIAKGPFTAERVSVVCGISSLNHVSLISVGGPGMRGRSGAAARIFRVISDVGVSLLLITQSSSEYTVSFCVKDSEAEIVKEACDKEFMLEIKAGFLNEIGIKKDCAIVSIVGDGMINSRGCAATFTKALTNKDINIYALAQGSSERCISAVIESDKKNKAVLSIHKEFFDKKQDLSLFIFGAGTIGGELIRQIKTEYQALLRQGVRLTTYAITTIDGMLVNKAGLNLDSWQEEMREKEVSSEESVATGSGTIKIEFNDSNVDTIIKMKETQRYLSPVFIDCTASDALPARYVDLLKAGFNIVTPNKRANASDSKRYGQLRVAANRSQVKFLYEANVGAGLPIIDTVQGLYLAGDRLTLFNGILSGSLSYIFGVLDKGVPFSQAVREAREKRFTEPDPRDDLKGIDVARKALIIAREWGYKLNYEDIKMENIFPETFNTAGSIEEFMSNLEQVDEYFSDKVSKLKEEDKVLRMGAVIETEGKVSVKVGIIEVGREDPLYQVKGGENAFVFYTTRYSPIPLTIKGYGAGAAVTAGGVFSDILRLTEFNIERE